MKPPQTPALSLSVVMPALNEERNIDAAIGDTLAALDELQIEGEVVVINDGSSDRTPELVRARMARDGRVKLVEHPVRQGIGVSFWDGVEHATGDAVIMLPGDNENDPLESLRYFGLLEHVDVVIPFVYNRQVRSVFRNVLSLVYRQIINTTFLTNFNYTNGTVLYRRSILKQFTANSKGFFFQTEILIRAVKNGYLFAEVPYHLNRREGGKSKAVSFPSLLNVIKGYLHLMREIYFGKDGAHPALQKDSVSSQRRTRDEAASQPPAQAAKDSTAPKDPTAKQVSTAPRQIPYVNLADQHVPIKAELLRAIGGVIDRGQFILGDEVAEFEKRFADLCGVRHAVAVNSGTDALIFALKSLGIGPGDEVITAPNSFIASTSCILIAGARPVFVDVCDDYNLDPEKLLAAITPRTKAILPVHLTGRPADMDPILSIAKARGLAVVEDCAQAVLAEYRGRRVGALGNAGCFSLHPLKTLNACGDGGVLTTDDDAVCQQARLHRNLGLQDRSNCVLWASNSRLDTLQAAILLVKLDYLDAWTERRRENAAVYQDLLGGLAECRLPQDRPHEKSVYHTFVIQAERRDELKQYLSDRGVGTSIHYPVPIHLQTVAAGLGYRPGCFPVTERQAEHILSLPVHHRMSKADLQYVSQTIRSFYHR